MWTFITIVWLTLAAFMWRQIQWWKFKDDMSFAAEKLVWDVLQDRIEERLRTVEMHISPSIAERNTMIVRWFDLTSDPKPILSPIRRADRC